MNSTYWKDIKKNKKPFFDDGISFKTLEGETIYWNGFESLEAQKWLRQNKSITEKTKSKKTK